MASIEVVGRGKAKVLSSLGYVHDVGAYVKEVELPDGSTAMVVKRAGKWQPWTPRDRTAPLRAAAARGWPLKESP